MKNLLTALLVVLCYTCTSAQPFSIGHRSFTVTDPSRSRQIPLELYYPADVAGNNVSFAQQAPSAPIVVFGHGFVMTWDAYANIWQSLVPAGYIVAFPTTEGSFAPSHLEFGKDLAFSVTAIQAEGQTPSSVLFGHVDSSACVMGHSMGGGSSFLAVQFNSSIRAIANLAAAETNPSAVAAAGNITIPALVIAGGNDCVAPPANHQTPMYNALISGCKTYFTITGGSHCQMAENNTLCSFGEATCTPAASISRVAQHATIDNYLLPWLNYQLKGDCAAGAAFDASIVADPSVTYQRSCQLCTSTGITAPGMQTAGWNIHPNPASEVLHVYLPKMTAGYLELMDNKGRMVRRLPVSGSAFDADIHSLPSGYYKAILTGSDTSLPPISFIKQD